MEIVLEFYVSKHHHQSPPIEGAIEAIEKLRYYYKIFVVTARTDKVRTMTEMWLDRHFPEVFEGVHFGNHHHPGFSPKKKKSEICDELGVEIFIEDSLSNALDVGETGRQVYLLNTPWNRKSKLPPNVVRVLSWTEIVDNLCPQSALI